MRDDTKLTHLGSSPAAHKGAVNPPVMRASTMVFPTLAMLDKEEADKHSHNECGSDGYGLARDASAAPYRYGIYGTETQRALCAAVAGLEGGYGVELVPSGLSAISTVMVAFLRHGDHVLVSENSYYPTRRFCDGSLAAFGIESDYFDADIGADIERLLRPNTRLIWLESPGSLTFEICDTAAIAAVAKSRGIVVVMDNTWSAGYFYKPLLHGADVSIQAGTKYIGGHSDILLGTIACASAEIYEKIHRAYCVWGLYVSPDEAYLALRGLRSLGVRMGRHEASGLRIAEYLRSEPEVVHIMHPGVVGDAYYDIWRRDFSGCAGLFGFVMRCHDRRALAAMVESLQLFRMGYSWGGFESLILPTDPAAHRSVPAGSESAGAENTGAGGCRRWPWESGEGYQTMRLHVGLEAVEDLIEDLQRGFAALRAYKA